MARSSFYLAATAATACIAIAGAPAQTPAPAKPAKTKPAPAAQTPAPAETSPGGKTVDARAWPRAYEIDGVQFSFYRPELDSWEGNVLKARAVMAVKTGETKGADGQTVPQVTYGVLWLTARTETDKAAREVVLDDLVADRASFPAAKDKEAAYLAMARKVLPTTEFVTSMDAIEASLAITDALHDNLQETVNNTPPEIIVSLDPAVLVLIDGDPVWRPTSVAGVEHVLNTRATILRYQDKLYAGRGGKWVSATALTGPWASVPSVPGPVSESWTQLMAKRQGPQQQASPNADPESAKFPEIFVRTKPAELVVIDGQPQFDDIEGTQLSYVTNSAADVFLDAGNNWYVLLAGRWFTAPSTKGPWTYIAPDKLPADFLKIPSDGPKGAVLASIAGTPEAKESLVANSVPQTATVNRMQASFTAQYDGAPQFVPVEGTSLAAAKNSPTPIIRVTDQSYYALANGVWFEAKSPTGPWAVATSVPPVIYTIPTTSPIHYVTFVRIYGSTAEVVYVGYTPGYYGTVASNGVVVYGTGNECQAWVGQEYYGCPTTYGYGAAFEYSDDSGWGVDFGYGWYYPWYYPYWGPWYPWYYPGYYPPYWGGAAYAFGNVYGRWGSSVVAGTGAAWANAWTGNYGRGFRGGYYNTRTGGRGYGYAGRNTNIYTGNTVAAAGGIRYNPQTGRVVAGQGGAAGNIYTGNAIAGGSRTAVNTNTGRVTQTGGVATRSNQGATVAGGINSSGAAGDIKGAGYVHYDRGTGDISSGGIANVNGNIYAGKDGNVYKYGDNGWEPVNGGPSASPRNDTTKSLDQDRAARSRGMDRDASSGRGFERSSPPPSSSFNRGSYGGGFSGRMGGFRGGGGFRR
jgi:hypothetical protein